MIDETKDDNVRIAEVFFSKNIKVHITLKSGSWSNGFITEMSSDFFMLDEQLNGLIPVFFNQVQDIQPYTQKKEEVK